MNMSYCMFENTYQDLLQCYDAIDEDLSVTEARYRKKLIDLCIEISDYINESEDF